MPFETNAGIVLSSHPVVREADRCPQLACFSASFCARMRCTSAAASTEAPDHLAARVRIPSLILY